MSVERLVSVAQRLDELAEDLPELQTLAEELQAVADAWPSPDLNAYRPTPLVLEIEKLIERAIYEKQSTNTYTASSAQQYYANLPVLDPKTVFKGLVSP